MPGQSRGWDWVPLIASVGPGNWGRLALGAPGGTQFENNLINGYQGSINVGDKVSAETGQVNGPTDEGVNIARVDAVKMW